MPYLLRGGPRDRQFVDDLPRGYRLRDGPTVPDIAGMTVDTAVWAESFADAEASDRTDAG